MPRIRPSKDENGKEYPLIAVIVSDSFRKCADFCHFHGLNPHCFVAATEIYHVQGYHYNTPIIVTYNNGGQDFRQMMEYINFKFRSIRYIDY